MRSTDNFLLATTSSTTRTSTTTTMGASVVYHFSVTRPPLLARVEERSDDGFFMGNGVAKQSEEAIVNAASGRAIDRSIFARSLAAGGRERGVAVEDDPLSHRRRKRGIFFLAPDAISLSFSPAALNVRLTPDRNDVFTSANPTSSSSSSSVLVLVPLFVDREEEEEEDETPSRDFIKSARAEERAAGAGRDLPA